VLERSSELRRQVPPASSEGSVGGSVLPLREHAPRRREHAPRRGEHAPRRGDTVGGSANAGRAGRCVEAEERMDRYEISPSLRHDTSDEI
jgi:hypothetical protein